MGEVTPHAGVWIETYKIAIFNRKAGVTPHAGVWIETYITRPSLCSDLSLPMRECGLKQQANYTYPFFTCHSPCGSVD